MERNIYVMMMQSKILLPVKHPQSKKNNNNQAPQIENVFHAQS